MSNGLIAYYAVAAILVATLGGATGAIFLAVCTALLLIAKTPTAPRP